MTQMFRFTNEGPDYLYTERKARQVNFEEAREAARNNEPWILRKAQQVEARFQGQVRAQNLINNAKRGNLYSLALISKDPKRQSLHQRAFQHWLERLQHKNLITNLIALPASGPNAQILLPDGTIAPRSVLTFAHAPSKSIDFAAVIPCRGGERRVYIAHKYTAEDGGAQDNQFQDIRTFLDFAGRNTDPNDLFVAVCDGQHYVRDRGNERTRLDVLIDMQVNLKSVAITSKRLPELLNYLSRMHTSLTPRV